MSRRPVVLVDMDNVMVNLLSAWLRQYEEVGGERVSLEAITEYNWEGFVKDRELFLRVLKSGGVFYEAEPMPMAKEGMRLLSEVAEVLIVTKALPSSSRTFDAKLHTLWRHFPGIDFQRVIFTGQKYLIRADYLIEDSAENVEKWLKANPEGHAFLIDWPYNKNFLHPRCTRVQSINHAAWLVAETLYEGQEVS